MFTAKIRIGLLLFWVAATWAQTVDPAIANQAKAIDANGNSYATLLDSLNVESKWAKDIHISYFGGVLNNWYATSSTATHCSAFAAAVAERLGIYLLRPPNHSQGLLANDQYTWVQTEGAALGWRTLARANTSLVELQAAANKGMLALIIKQNLNLSEPGHIAVVRPNAANSTEWLLANGPQLIQSGSTNYNNVTAKKIFNLSATNVIFAIYDRRTEAAQLPALLWKDSNKPRIIYAIDSAPGASLDALKLEYNSTKGFPIWYISAAGIGSANSSSWNQWYKWRKSVSSTNEPYFNTRQSTSASFAVSSSSLGVTDGGVTITTARDTATVPVAGITGNWLAQNDSLIYSVFISYSTSTKVGGYVLGWDSQGYSEFQTLDLTWTTTGSTATGLTKKCKWPTSGSGSSAVSCTQSSSSATSVSLSITGNSATITGLSYYPTTAIVLEKATMLKPFLGPVV